MKIATCAALATLLIAAPCAADEPPTRKAGLWESKIANEGMPDSTVRQCVDDETDKRAMGAMGAASQCAKKTFTRVEDGYLTASECKMAGMTITGTGKVSGDFATTMRVEQTTVTTGMPGSSKPQTRKTVIEARRVGDCEPGQKPGDMIMPDGRIVRTPGSVK